MRFPIRGLFLASLLVPGAAAAQTVTQEQANVLRQQLTDTFSELLGPAVKLADLPLKITAAGDHYDMSWPIPGLEVPAGDPAVMAELKPLDGGRWSLEKARFPSAGSFSFTLPDTSAGPGGPMKGTYSISKQDLQWTIDPNFASPSTSHSEVQGLALTMDGAKKHQEEHVDRMAGQAVLTPTKDGRLDLTSDATAEGLKSAALEDNKPAIAFGARRVHATTRAEGINRAHVADFWGAFVKFIALMPKPPEKKGDDTELTPLAKAQLRLMIAAMQDTVTSISMQETVDDMQIEIADKGGGDDQTPAVWIWRRGAGRQPAHLAGYRVRWRGQPNDAAAARDLSAQAFRDQADAFRRAGGGVRPEVSRWTRATMIRQSIRWDRTWQIFSLMVGR